MTRSKLPEPARCAYPGCRNFFDVILCMRGAKAVYACSDHKAELARKQREAARV